MSAGDSDEGLIQRKALFVGAQFAGASVKVGSHFWREWFDRHDFDTAYVSDPLPAFAILRGRGEANGSRLAVWREAIKGPNARDLVPLTFHPAKRTPSFLGAGLASSWSAFSLPGPKSWLNRRGFEEVDFLYIDSPIHFGWLKDVKSKYSILRIPDKFSAFKGAYGRIDDLARRVGSIVSEVIYSSVALKDYAEEISGGKATYVPNAVDLKLFSDSDGVLPDEYVGLNSPIAVYVGDLGYRFDIDLLKSCANELPKVNFVVIGDCGAVDASNLPENVMMLGSKPYEVLPAYLKNASIGLIPFNVEEYPDLVASANPLKLYQYLAAGIPVVSTYWHGLAQLDSPAILARSRSEFVSELKRALSEDWCSSELERWASAFDWDVVISRFLDGRMRMVGVE